MHSCLSNYPINIMMIPHYHNPPRKKQVFPLTYEIKTSYDPLVGRGPQPLPSTFSSQDRFLILGSWNGLVALYREGGDLCLFNPYVVGKEIIVHVTINVDSRSTWPHGMLFGLCHDPANDEYKAVISCSSISCSHKYYYVVSFKDGSCKVKSFRDRSLYHGRYKEYETRTIVRGVPYWICMVNWKHLVMYFDLKTEELRPAPKLPNGKQILELGSLDGQLTTTLKSDEGLEIWALKEHENGECSWSMVFVVLNEWPSLSTIVWMIKEVEVLIDVNREVLMIYNIKKGTWRQLQRKMKRSLYSILAYVPTLISPIQ